ncbi:MAG: superoxide dismutase family protein [Isosphaeraceae bacterium]
MRRQSLISAFAAGAVCACTLGTATLQAQHGDAPMSDVTKAIAVLYPTKGSEVAGVVTFTKVADGVKVVGRITGLTPGKHGFHVHEFGDPSDPAAKSAGGHFNPKGAPHGAPGSGKRHVGDLGNIEANASGVAEIDVVDPMLSFHGPASILGRGLIVHEKADDLTTQPTGDAGGRVAVAVIGVTKGQ